MNRPTCEQVAELLARFVEAQKRGLRVHSDILEQAECAIHELLQPITGDEIVELAALGSAVGQGMLTELGKARALRN